MIASLKPLLLQAKIQSFAPNINCQRFPSEDIEELIAGLIGSSTQQDVHTQCSKARAKFGFDYFALFMSTPSTQSQPFAYVMREFTNAWSAHYEKSRLLLDDPSIPLTLSNTVPTVWVPGKYQNIMDDRQKLAVDQAYEFGLRKVIGFSARGSNGGQLALRFHQQENGLSSLLADDGIVCQLELSLFTNHVYAALQRILKSGGQEAEAQPTLTNKELDVLRWVASGHSSWAIGEKLYISENTVLKHLKKIHKKLNVHTRQHAVARAIAMGMIQV